MAAVFTHHLSTSVFPLNWYLAEWTSFNEPFHFHHGNRIFMFVLIVIGIVVGSRAALDPAVPLAAAARAKLVGARDASDPVVLTPPRGVQAPLEEFVAVRLLVFCLLHQDANSFTTGARTPNKVGVDCHFMVEL
jgi:hypothetical protein